MKNILSLFLALIAVGYVNANVIEPDAPLGMSVIKNGSVVKVFYRGEQSENVKVSIFNEKGDVVFTEVMKDIENFMRPYNFSSLPPGDYTIELNDSHETRVEKVTYGPEKRTDTAIEKDIAYLVRLDEHESRYMLAVVNDGYDALTIRIYDRNNRLVHEDVQEIEGNFSKVYNLNKIAGDHTFEVVNANGSVTRLQKNTR